MQVKDEGYEIEHEGYCITIFSAPNYCDVRLCLLTTGNCCSAPLPAVACRVPALTVLLRMLEKHKVCCCSAQLMFSMPSADACVVLCSKWATRVRSSPSRVMTLLRVLRSTQRSRTPVCGPCSMQVGTACLNTRCCSVMEISAVQTAISVPSRSTSSPKSPIAHSSFCSQASASYKMRRRTVWFSCSAPFTFHAVVKLILCVLGTSEDLTGCCDWVSRRRNDVAAHGHVSPHG